MMKVLTACTLEMDDPQSAVTEILEQLDLDHSLRKHSAGLLMCFSGFLESGVVRELCAVLPFPVIGGTSLGASIERSSEMPMLSLCVLTSDEVCFSPLLTEPLADLSIGEVEERLQSAYREALSALPAKPSLNLVCLPLITNIPGESVVETLDKISGGTPLFGTTVCDHHPDFHDSSTIYNGESSKDRLVMLLMSGPVDPRFAVITLSLENTQKQAAIVTDSEGQILKKVNNMSAHEYLVSLGLAQIDSLEGAVSIPFLVDFHDGTPPVARAMFALTEEGYAACGGFVPVNSTLAVGTMNYQDVMSSLDQLTPFAARSSAYRGMLVVSCITRSIALEVDPDAEAEKIEHMFDHSVPYQLSYSCGEICPVTDAEGNIVNRYHNFTLVACLF